MNICVLTLLLLLPVATLAQQAHEVLAVCFYNFENLFHPEDDPQSRGDDDFTPEGAYHYTEAVYRQKLHNLAVAIKQIGTAMTPGGPALIGTAEIENARVLEDLVGQPKIRDRRYRFVHFDGPDHRGIDVALLYQPRYFRVLSAVSLPVDISAYAAKGGKTRDILYVAGVLAGDTVHVLVNHWPSRRGGEAASAPLRAVAAGVARRVIDSLRRFQPDARVILMGDLNDDPVSPSVVRVLGASGDRSKVKDTGLYNPWVQFYRKGNGTLGHNDSWNLFDQIIISGSWLHRDPTRWRYYKAEVFNREFLKTPSGRYKGYPHRSFDGTRWINGYSDHFPTVIYLVRAARRASDD
jgi:hypothetical protein